jgi:hypothetical protein
MTTTRYNDLQKRDDFFITKEQTEKSRDDLERIKKLYGEGALAPFAQRFYEFQKRVLWNYAASGIISEETFEKIIEANPHYVPFKRIFQDIGNNAGKNLNNPKLYKIKGSKRGVKNVFAGIVENVNNILKVSQDNQVKRDIAELAKTFPQEIQITDNPKLDERHIEFRDNGKIRYLRLSKPLYDALKPVADAANTAFLNILVFPSKVLRTAATTFNLPFGLKNFFRDNVSAMINSKDFNAFFDSLKQLKSIIKKDDDYQNFLRSGASMGSFMEMDDAALERYAKALFTNKSATTTQWLFKYSFGKIEQINNLLEQLTRYGVYQKTKNKGASDIEAAAAAREATLDFARMGSAIKFLNRLIPFFCQPYQAWQKGAVENTNGLIRRFLPESSNFDTIFTCAN